MENECANKGPLFLDVARKYRHLEMLEAQIEIIISIQTVKINLT